MARPSVEEFIRDDAGHPLGVGMPTGAPLRIDFLYWETGTWRGESHLQAWERITRLDPCAYCGAPAGTVDHIEPKRQPVKGLGGAHSWLNVAAACEGCNGSKRDKPLWWFLWTRSRSRPRRELVSLGTPTRKAA